MDDREWTQKGFLEACHLLTLEALDVYYPLCALKSHNDQIEEAYIRYLKYVSKAKGFYDFKV